MPEGSLVPQFLRGLSEFEAEQTFYSPFVEVDLLLKPVLYLFYQ